MITIEKRDQFTIEFADWVQKLSSSQMVSVWSKNGEHKGLFTMDTEQLLEIFKTKRDTEMSDEESKTEWNTNVVAGFMEHCKEKGFDLPDSVFESYFGA